MVAAESRRGGAPTLDVASSAATLAAWLQWCDPNGSHTAELAAADGADPYTLDEAWYSVALMLNDD